MRRHDWAIRAKLEPTLPQGYNCTLPEYQIPRRLSLVKLVVSALLILAVTPTALAQEPKPSVDIHTEYLMTIEAKLGRGCRLGNA